MRFLYWLADNVFRFRYRSPFIDKEDDLIMTWDIGIYEDEMNKMHRDFFIMGVTLSAVILIMLAGLTWLIAR